MPQIPGRFIASFLILALARFAPAEQPVRLESTSAPPSENGVYVWEGSPLGPDARLLTLKCRGCYGIEQGGEVPLVSVLRDTLGDQAAENDRVSYVWLLSTPHLSVGQRVLSAVPFFFWRIGKGSSKLTRRDLTPEANLTAPQNPMFNTVSRQLLQWTAFDPLTNWVRTSSRNYQSNSSDNARFRIEQTISYLRHAPTSDSSDGLTANELRTVIARLELRKSLLGGLVDNRHAARFADEEAFESERIRSRNWELLRECAEKTGLVFEPVDLGSTKGQYAFLWYPVGVPQPQSGTSTKPVYKLLNIKDPWSDERLTRPKGFATLRSFDNNGHLLPEGDTSGTQQRLIPLGLYSLNYPKLPLLLIDFRDRLHVRRHEMTQRSINQITTGVVGLSHIANWYYFAGAMAYDFVTSRHGSAVNMADRLDCYSDFQAQLTMDRSLSGPLRHEVVRRSQSLTVSPLDSSAELSASLARTRHALLASAGGPGSPVLNRLNRDRRAELAAFGESTGSSVWHGLLHFASFQLYTERVAKDRLDKATLDRERRFEYQIAFLDDATRNGTQPEIAISADQIQSAVNELRELQRQIASPVLRSHASATVTRVASLSHDGGIQASCRDTILALNREPNPERPSAPLGVTGSGASVVGGAALTLSTAFP